MQIPAETLDRLSFRCKRVAAAEMNLEQLRREGEAVRREWWAEVEKDRAEYTSLRYDPDQFLESNFALARLKLAASFRENGELMPPGHGFRDEELELLKDFERYIVYDRLSVEDIRDFVRNGTEDGRGIIALARNAAVSGYDHMYRLMQQRSLPNDLALAFQRIYQERIKKMEAAAAELRLSEVDREIEAGKAGAAAEGAAGEAGGRVITSVEARLLERSYIDQVEARLRGAAALPAGERLAWKKVRRGDSLPQVLAELQSLKPVSPEGVREGMPLGLQVSAVVQSGSLLRRRVSLALQARAVSNYKELHLRGFDTPISFGDLMRHVSEVGRLAGGRPCVLALASPAGWDEESVAYARAGRGLAHGLSLLLLGLKERQMYYHEADARLKDVLPYVEIGK